MPQYKINPNRYAEPTLPGLDAFDAPAGYQEIALKFGASIIPLTDASPRIAARQQQLRAAFVRETAKPSPLDPSAEILPMRHLHHVKPAPLWSMVSAPHSTDLPL